MKLNGDSAEDGGEATITSQEVHSFRGADQIVNRDDSFAVLLKIQAVFNQTVLREVEQIRFKDMIIDAIGDFVQHLNGWSSWIALRESGQDRALQVSVNHLLGLHDRRFDWNQNDITAWPGTHLGIQSHVLRAQEAISSMASKALGFSRKGERLSNCTELKCAEMPVEGNLKSYLSPLLWSSYVPA